MGSRADLADEIGPAEAECACVLCAIREIRTVLHVGRCCQPCRDRIDRDLGQLVLLAARAEEELVPRRGAAGSGARSYESKAPIRLDNIAPHLAIIELTPGDPSSRVTITDSMTSWEVVIRSQRGYVSYGVATEDDAGDPARGWTTSEIRRSARAFAEAVKFLRRNLDWIAEYEEFPLEQFVDEVRWSRAAISSMLAAGLRDHLVSCPTPTNDGPCGATLTVHTWAALEHDASTGAMTHCPRCGAVRTATQLLRAAGSDETWADTEALAAHFGVSQTVIRKWARAGKVRRRNGLYRWTDVRRQAELLHE